jgi:biofilm protein TabA
MVLDSLSNWRRYAALHPRFDRAFAYVMRTDLAAHPPGRVEIDGERIYVSIDHVDGRGHEAARLEAHAKYIDIQVTIAGEEVIGWRALADCERPEAAPDDAKDVRFYGDRPDTWLAVPRGHFAIFFPEDAHAPLAGTGQVRKAVVKVRRA